MIFGLLYVGLIILANVLATRWIIPLPFSLAVPAGVFVIAPIFTLRDEVHERYGRKGAYLLVAIAAVISWGTSIMTGNTLLARITLSSVIAFVFNGMLDTEIYHELRKKSRLSAILGSNAISSLVDSVLFIWVAFGPLWQLMLGQYMVKMLISTLVGLWITRKR